MPLENLTGVITYWNLAKGYGFAVRDDGEADVFVPLAEVDSDVETLPLGARIQFRLRMNPRTGREQACDTVTIRSGKRLRGVIKCWHHSQQFAFITCSDGRDLYAHESAFASGPIGAGEAVEFELTNHPKSSEQIAIFVERQSAPSTISSLPFMQSHHGEISR